MILATTPTIEGKRSVEHKGLVFGEAVVGSQSGSFLRDAVAGMTGKGSGIETKLEETRSAAVAEMKERAGALGANAVIGVTLDHEQLVGCLLLSTSGTAVVVE